MIKPIEKKSLKIYVENLIRKILRVFQAFLNPEWVLNRISLIELELHSSEYGMVLVKGLYSFTRLHFSKIIDFNVETFNFTLLRSII